MDFYTEYLHKVNRPLTTCKMLFLVYTTKTKIKMNQETHVNHSETQ